MKRRRRLIIRLLSILCVGGMLMTALPMGVALAKAESQEKKTMEWSDMQALLSEYTAEWTEPTYEGLITNRVPHTALLGNGDVGVASGGDEYSKNFYISKSDFWGYNDGPKAIGGVIIKAAEEAKQEHTSLAYNKPVTASTVHEDFQPSRALNGEWSETYEGWVSQVGNPQWMQIDLQENTVFDRIVISHKNRNSSADASNTKAFAVKISTDNTNWETVYETDDNHSGLTDVTLDTPVTARYVRLEVVKGTQETNNDSIQYPRARIAQFELYNTANTPVDDTDGAAPTEHFLEKQDILNARILTEMELDSVPVVMETKMMANANLLVTKITSQGDTDVDLMAEVWGKSDNTALPTTAAVTDYRATVTRTIKKINSNDPNSFNSEAALTAQIIGAEVTGTAKTTSTADLSFTLPAGETVYVVTAVGGGGRTYNYLNQLQGEAPINQAAALLDGASTVDQLQALDEDHAAWWKDYWSASSIQLDTDDERLQWIQKYYYAAQYELGCTVRNGNVAAGLYGIWHTTDNPSWRSDYHLNYNFIATYYGAATSNHPELLLPAIDAITAYVEKGPSDMATIQKFAAEKGNEAVQAFVQSKIEDGSIDPETGIEGGVLFPVGIGPWGMKLDANYHNQTFNAPFSVYPLVQYYEATQDDAFLQDVLYEYVKPILTFLEAWVVKGEDGYYDIYAGYCEGTWALNSAGELAMYRLCLRYAIMASEQFGVDADRRAVWQDLYDNLAPYPTMEYNGKTMYAMADQYYEDGEWKAWDQSPGRLTLESIFPGKDFGYYSTQEELDLWYNTIQAVDEENIWPGINCFPEMFTQALMMRYDPEIVVDELSANIQRLIQTNLTIDDTVHGVEKIGATEAVHAMLLQEDKGVVKVFPAWLKGQDASFHNLRANGAFLMSAAYDSDRQEVSYVDITSEAGKTITVACPWADMVVTDNTGKVVNATVGTAPNHSEEITYTFATEEGMTYHLSKGEKSMQVDKSALQTAIEQAENTGLDAAIFTPDSLADYQKALDAAKAVLANDDATQGNVQAALSELAQAFDRLAIQPSEIVRFSAAEQTYAVNNTATSKKTLYTDWKAIDGGTPVDLSGYDLGNLYLQMKVNLTKAGTTLADGSLYNGGVVKLRSVDDNGENNIGWSLGSRGLATGDNRLSICLNEKPASATGTIDWTQINRLNMYIDSVNSKEGQFTMTLSNVVIVDATVANAKNALLAVWGTDIGDQSYTQESLASYQTAKAQATAILNDPQATEQEVIAATTVLQTALDGLTLQSLLGDVNDSGDVTAEDALLALQAATNKIVLNDAQTAVADVDSTAGVTANDALLILQYATKKIASF